MSSQKPKKQLNKYLRFSGIAFQMGATIYLAAYFGKRLDNYFEMEKKVFTLSLILLATVVSIWSINRQLKKINE